jgi:hypothetical protein
VKCNSVFNSGFELISLLFVHRLSLDSVSARIIKELLWFESY